MHNARKILHSIEEARCMQIRRIGYQVRGFGRITDYALRWAYVITEKAKHKGKVLAFWQKHGMKATRDAFGVKRRTLYWWKKQQKEGGGKLEVLNTQFNPQLCNMYWHDTSHLETALSMI